MNFSEEEREAYEGRLKWLRIESTTLRKAESKGFEKGITKGLKQGHKKGLQKGRQERDREIVLEMLKENLSIKQVSKLTGLPIKEIKALQK